MRRYHSKLPLRLFADRNGENYKSDSESDDENDSTKFADSTSRKRKISTDGDVSHRKRIVSYSEESDSEDSDNGDSSENVKRFKNFNKGPKASQQSRPHISHPPRKISISPDTQKVIKKLKRKHKERAVKHKIGKNLERRRKNKRKRLRRKVVVPKYIEPANTDDEVDNVSDSDMDVPEVNENADPDENENFDEGITEFEGKNVDENVDENRESANETSDDSSSDESGEEHISWHVNCVTIEDFEKSKESYQKLWR